MFDGVKVFSATRHTDRAAIGEQVTDWLTANANKVEIVDTVVKQSSDSEFHCLSILLFYKRIAMVKVAVTPVVQRAAGGAKP
jgi:hypothetical protein